MPWAEQAIFTSIRGERLDGYQLAATSPGISGALARELTLWGPAHDAMIDPEWTRESVAWFPLSDEQHCLAVTQPAGHEYSGRQGPRIYTQFIVLPEAVVERLVNPAWDTYHALRLAGRLAVRDPLPPRLERCPISVTGTVRLLNQKQNALADELTTQLISDPVAVVPAVQPTLAIVCEGDANAQFEGVWQQLPETLRRTTSFATGLRYSARRPFRVQATPAEPTLLRQLAREPSVRVLEAAHAA